MNSLESSDDWSIDNSPYAGESLSMLLADNKLDAFQAIYDAYTPERRITFAKECEAREFDENVLAIKAMIEVKKTLSDDVMADAPPNAGLDYHWLACVLFVGGIADVDLWLNGSPSVGDVFKAMAGIQALVKSPAIRASDFFAIDFEDVRKDYKRMLDDGPDMEEIRFMLGSGKSTAGVIFSSICYHDLLDVRGSSIDDTHLTIDGTKFEIANDGLDCKIPIYIKDDKKLEDFLARKLNVNATVVPGSWAMYVVLMALAHEYHFTYSDQQTLTLKREVVAKAPLAGPVAPFVNRLYAMADLVKALAIKYPPTAAMRSKDKVLGYVHYLLDKLYFDKEDQFCLENRKKLISLQLLQGEGCKKSYKLDALAPMAQIGALKSVGALLTSQTVDNDTITSVCTAMEARRNVENTRQFNNRFAGTDNRLDGFTPPMAGSIARHSATVATVKQAAVPVKNVVILNIGQGDVLPHLKAAWPEAKIVGYNDAVKSTLDVEIKRWTKDSPVPPAATDVDLLIDSSDRSGAIKVASVINARPKNTIVQFELSKGHDMVDAGSDSAIRFQLPYGLNGLIACYKSFRLLAPGKLHSGEFFFVGCERLPQPRDLTQGDYVNYLLFIKAKLLMMRAANLIRGNHFKYALPFHLTAAMFTKTFTPELLKSACNTLRVMTTFSATKELGEVVSCVSKKTKEEGVRFHLNSTEGAREFEEALNRALTDVGEMEIDSASMPEEEEPDGKEKGLEPPFKKRN